MKRPGKKPELMSPAGYWPQLKAAIEQEGIGERRGGFPAHP
jgi:hypothetical protein